MHFLHGRQASNQFDSLRLSLQRGPRTTVPLVSSWLSNRAADSNPRIRHDPYKGWNINPYKGSILLCSLGIASFPEVAAACKRFAKSIALKMSIVFRVVFRKLLPTSCRCASRPSPAVPTVTLLGIPIASFKLKMMNMKKTGKNRRQSNMMIGLF